MFIFSQGYPDVFLLSFSSWDRLRMSLQSTYEEEKDLEEQPFLEDNHFDKSSHNSSDMDNIELELREETNTSKSRIKSEKFNKWFWNRKKRQQPSNPNTHTVITSSRIIRPAERLGKYPANLVINQKYRLWSFLPVVLYNQFRYFFNLYFLLVSLSQLIPMLQVTYLITCLGPLSLVLTITLGKEALDDYRRYLRDKELNSQRYTRLEAVNSKQKHVRDRGGNGESLESPTIVSTSTAIFKGCPSSDIQVGDIITVRKGERIPADMILLRTGGDQQSTGSTFVRTDQLDGETDWKLRHATCQNLHHDPGLMLTAIRYLEVDGPRKDIHSFVGTIYMSDGTSQPLSVEHVLWSNTVLATGSAIGLVIYTGSETRASMNTSQPETKSGSVEEDLNRLSKCLCMILVLLSTFLVWLYGFNGMSLIYLIRYIVLFSTIIPISLRVNLDMGKTVYSSDISSDPAIPGVIVRTSTISEELGRIRFLLSDKTGTLTKNDMELKKIHLGTISFTHENIQDIRIALQKGLLRGEQQPEDSAMTGNNNYLTRGRRDLATRLLDTVIALGLCHNVTPVEGEEDDQGRTTYHASSPDEVAIVRWTEHVGVRLVFRDRDLIQLSTESLLIDPSAISTSSNLTTTPSPISSYRILYCFPFTSESKRMGIVVRDEQTNKVWFYQKGADVVMSKLVQQNDWLEEECGNMAREGLRTLVIARKLLSEEEFVDFQGAMHRAQLAIHERTKQVTQNVTRWLEHDLELLAVTGVEDKLQDDVKPTLESLRQAGIKVWMLTGDKVETAHCIAISSRLFARNQPVIQVQALNSKSEIENVISRLQRPSTATGLTVLNGNKAALVIDGKSLEFASRYGGDRFWRATLALSAVIACRCTPTQKADVARAIRRLTGQSVCCIGDGGNDVSMIQAANVGIGIVGKEGMQASLAADFSISSFSHIQRLLLWHGRNSYQRTAKLSQFVIHRGFVIAMMQAIFSACTRFTPIALYQGVITVGYTTIYTMAPVFSLVLDRDIPPDLAILYPELYKDLARGLLLSMRVFFKWLLISTYQAGAIMIGAMVLFERDLVHLVAITFSSLVLNELLMVALEVSTWHPVMILSEFGSMLIYILSMYFLKGDFDPSFVWTWGFLGRVMAITAVSFAPLFIIKLIRWTINPPSYVKLTE